MALEVVNNHHGANTANPKALPETAPPQTRFECGCCVVATLASGPRFADLAALARRSGNVEFAAVRIAATRANSLQSRQVSAVAFRRRRPGASQGATLNVESGSARLARRCGLKINSSSRPHRSAKRICRPCGEAGDNGSEIAVSNQPSRKNHDLGFSDRSDRKAFHQDQPAQLLGTRRPRPLIQTDQIPRTPRSN
jgi:hypothetical protein